MTRNSGWLYRQSARLCFGSLTTVGEPAIVCLSRCFFRLSRLFVACICTEFFIWTRDSPILPCFRSGSIGLIGGLSMRNGGRLRLVMILLTSVWLSWILDLAFGFQWSSVLTGIIIG